MPCAFHPGKPRPRHAPDRRIVNKVIRELTGCSCLSGVIDVIWERDFDRVLDGSSARLPGLGEDRDGLLDTDGRPV